MKKLLICTLTIAFAIIFTGCSTPSVEKSPVVIEDSNEDSPENITQSDSDNTTSNSDNSEASDTEVSPGLEDLEADESDNNSSKDTEATLVSEEPFESSINIEGTEEKIMCKTFQSTLGYHIAYDIDRFSATTKDGSDTFMAENPDPELYPYVFLNISRVEYAIDGNSAVSDISAISIYNSLNDIDVSKLKELEPVIIGGHTATHKYYQEGDEWNSVVRHFYTIYVANNVYNFEVQYFLEASEGYGARIQAMLDTFTLK